MLTFLSKLAPSFCVHFLCEYGEDEKCFFAVQYGEDEKCFYCSRLATNVSSVRTNRVNSRNNFQFTHSPIEINFPYGPAWNVDLETYFNFMETSWELRTANFVYIS